MKNINDNPFIVPYTDEYLFIIRDTRNEQIVAINPNPWIGRFLNYELKVHGLLGTAGVLRFNMN